ncbi:MAG: hypothetical protein KC592_16110, partial [Nitrospira sp.]|nr:hypothetical protein [Nitrospira sp.]
HHDCSDRNHNEGFHKVTFPACKGGYRMPEVEIMSAHVQVRGLIGNSRVALAVLLVNRRKRKVSTTPKISERLSLFT